MPEFPEGFLWGAATSAYQIEGGNENCDWWEWEQSGSVRESCGPAADSWNRWRVDLDIAVELGLNVYRISTEWSRIEPSPGGYDEAAIAHYAEILSEAKRRGLKTMLVLWHFTNPSWMVPLNDWMWREAPDRFEAYARIMAERLHGLVDFWVTMNEANTYVWRGYIVGDWPPGRHDAWLGGLLCVANMARAHRQARKAIRDVVGPQTAVGITHVLVWPHAAESGGRLSRPMVTWWNFIANDLFLDRLAPHADWIGVQYYHDSPARTFVIDHEDGKQPRTDMGWRIVPRGLYEVVMRAWRRYRKPIIITENGLADADDSQRARFIIDHLAWLRRAITEGADVRGYLYWSLIDNFEWSDGFGPRFGLAEVDYSTFERRLRPSARVYAEIVARNGVQGLGEGLRYADGTGSLAPEG